MNARYLYLLYCALPPTFALSSCSEEITLSEEFYADSLCDKGLKYSEAGDYKSALECYRKAAAYNYPIAQYNIGLYYEKGRVVEQSYEEAAKWYKAAASQGHTGAQNNLGFLYQEGKGVPQSYEEAAKWYKLAIEQGNKYALGNLGHLYLQGQGLPQDREKAVQLFRKAAELGCAVSLNNLGACYENGWGVTQSYDEAAKFYLKAAEQGEPMALYNLGRCYEFGAGVALSLSEAKTWYEKASAMGEQQAQKILEDLAARQWMLDELANKLPDFNAETSYRDYIKQHGEAATTLRKMAKTAAEIRIHITNHIDEGHEYISLTEEETTSVREILAEVNETPILPFALWVTAEYEKRFTEAAPPLYSYAMEFVSKDGTVQHILHEGHVVMGDVSLTNEYQKDHAAPKYMLSSDALARWNTLPFFKRLQEKLDKLATSH